MSDKKICITLYNDNIELAKNHCPQGYHIEYTRNGHLLYVLDGYYYDIECDLCIKNVDIEEEQ